jgi:glycosyltransferase involved in cell wall biosynthesis
MEYSDKYIQTQLSIIVCCYGGEKTIEACLESLTNLSVEENDVEILIVDDGSMDGTAPIIADYLDKNSDLVNPVFRYFRKNNEGLSIARNFGIRKAEFDTVAFIDEDAVADKYFASNILNLFNENVNINCIAGKVDLLNDDIEFAQLLQSSIFSHGMKSQNAIIGTNMAFRKSVFANYGYFQPEFTYRGDESALIAKARNKINILKSDLVKVKHNQPPTYSDWIKTRYENGYFSAAIHHLVKKDNGYPFIKLRWPLISLGTPVSLIIMALFRVSNAFIILIGLVYFLIFLKKFFISKLIPDIVDVYRKNSNASIFKILTLTILIINGVYTEGYGYVKGFFKFRRVSWTKTEY